MQHAGVGGEVDPGCRALIARGRFDRLDHGHVLPHDLRHHRVKVLIDERAVECEVVREPGEQVGAGGGLRRHRVDARLLVELSVAAIDLPSFCEYRR